MDDAIPADSRVPTDIENAALCHQAHGYTYRLDDCTDHKKGGTAVAVGIGDRHFLATAAHVVPTSHSFEVVFPKGQKRVVSFAAHHFDRDVDVGLLEIERSDVGRLGAGFLPITDVLVNLDQHREWGAIVLGFPAQLTRPVHREHLRGGCDLQINAVSSFTYCSRTRRIAEWPTEGLEEPSDESRDIFVHFEPENRVSALHPKNAGSVAPSTPCQAPALSGISGGGIWVARERATPVWRPQCLLAGIAIASFPRDKWIHGRQIGRWLDLVLRHYPKLAKCIGEARNLTHGTARPSTPAP
ncbi:MAG: hypothetical protein NTW87_25600 [Planctomycetota bacterium]|nr:hypothetical protein [Planctomycetota bacterium]